MLSPVELRKVVTRHQIRSILEGRAGMDDPDTFADEIEEIFWNREPMTQRNGGISIDEVLCPEAFATSVQAREAFLLEYPDLRSGRNAFSTYDEEFLALRLAMFSAGMRVGAAFESARRSVVGDTMVCRRCEGVGTLALEYKNPEASHVCEQCKGLGVVPIPSSHSVGVTEPIDRDDASTVAGC